MVVEKVDAIVRCLKSEYDKWHDENKPMIRRYNYSVISSEKERVIVWLATGDKIEFDIFSDDFVNSLPF